MSCAARQAEPLGRGQLVVAMAAHHAPKVGSSTSRSVIEQADLVGRLGSNQELEHEASAAARGDEPVEESVRDECYESGRS